MDPFIGEIRMFAGSFAPQGWEFCHGQRLNIRDHHVLYTILGNQYGGDGTTTFALPDLRDRVPIHQGQGEGLAHRTIGEKGGTPTVTLNLDQMPAHNHLAGCQTIPVQDNPANQVWASTPGKGTPTCYAQSPNVAMNGVTIASVGGGQAHNNVQPFTGIHYIIALVGEYPPR